MKPIEPGCRAIVANCIFDVGAVVTVIGPVPARIAEATHGVRYFYQQGPLWKVDRGLTWKGALRDFDNIPYCPEECLIRLDDDWGKTVGWGALKDIWKPEEATA